VVFLCEHGALIDKRNNNNESPLMAACRTGRSLEVRARRRDRGAWGVDIDEA
jgi:ankyrin repeat protein